MSVLEVMMPQKDLWRSKAGLLKMWAFDRPVHGEWLLSGKQEECIEDNELSDWTKVQGEFIEEWIFSGH